MLLCKVPVSHYLNKSQGTQMVNLNHTVQKNAAALFWGGTFQLTCMLHINIIDNMETFFIIAESKKKVL